MLYRWLKWISAKLNEYKENVNIWDANDTLFSTRGLIFKSVSFLFGLVKCSSEIENTLESTKVEYFTGCFLLQGLLYERRWHCFYFATLYLEARGGICIRNNLPFHNSEVILSHLCSSMVKESLYCYFWNVLFFCVLDLLFVWSFLALTPFEFSYASSFCAIKLRAISYIIRFDLIAAILDIELLIP